MPLIALLLATATPGVAADALLAAYRAAWDRADATALAELYTADAELVSAAATAAGRPAIAELYTGAFAGGMGATVLTTRLDGVRAIAPGITRGRGAWRIAPQPGRAGEAYCGRFVAVLRAVKGRWRIASFDETQLACAAVWP